jgi:hypothetical protein
MKVGCSVIQECWDTTYSKLVPDAWTLGPAALPQEVTVEMCMYSKRIAFNVTYYFGTVNKIDACNALANLCAHILVCGDTCDAIHPISDVWKNKCKELGGDAHAKLFLPFADNPFAESIRSMRIAEPLLSDLELQQKVMTALEQQGHTPDQLLKWYFGVYPPMITKYT